MAAFARRVKARFQSICGICGLDILVGHYVIYRPRKHDYIHQGCAPGSDDE